jgi:DNA-binding transcriptional ArsR family regulator
MHAFAAVAEPHRRRILDRLREGECAVGDLVDLLRISQPGVSKHLRVLREARLVAVRADGKRRVYRLAAEPLSEVDEWLARYRPFWTERLDALEAHLEANP